MAALNPKKSGRLSSAGPEIQAFVSHYSANFQPILDCFIPSFKLKYGDSENIKADRVNTVVFSTYMKSNVWRFFGLPFQNPSRTMRKKKAGLSQKFHNTLPHNTISPSPNFNPREIIDRI